MDHLPEQLISAYLDGALDEAQSAELSQWVLASKDNARYLASLATLEQGLVKQARMRSNSDILSELHDDASHDHDDHATADLPPIHIDTHALTKEKYVSALTYVLQHTFTPKRIATLATAAALLFGTVLTIVLLTGPDTPAPIADTLSPNKPAASAEPTPRGFDSQHTPIVATLTADHDAQWGDTASAAPIPGDTLRAGDRLTLTAGFAEITTNDGAVAILEAPATIELTDHNNAIRLHAGKLVGICETESSNGFLVRTPHMDITDLGTRFGVDATNLDATQVHVFDGRVSVHAKGEPHDAATARILSTGMAISQKGDFSEPVLFNASHTAFASNLVPNELGNTAIIDRFGRVDTSATDQIAMDGGSGWAGPWQIERHRMSLDTRIGVDRPLASGTGRYLDASYTRTGNDSIASLVRRYDRFEGFGRSKPHRISFLIRTGDSFTPSSPIDRRIAIFDSSRAMNSTSGSDTWTILAYGYPDIQPSNDSLNTLNVDACSWSFYDGQADAQNKDLADLAKIKDTGIKIIPGQTYSIHVTVWPEEAAWDLVIVGNNERYDSREALGRPLRFRSSAKEAGGYLHFHMRDQETGYENHLHIDEVRIEPITNRTRSTED